MTPSDLRGAAMAFWVAWKWTGGPTFQAWLKEVHQAGIADGCFVYRFPPGLNRSRADCDRCIKAAEDLGLVQPTGHHTLDRSARAFDLVHFTEARTFRVPPKDRAETRDPFYVSRDLKMWEPGPNARLLRDLVDCVRDGLHGP